jgi:hypothetical protein
MAEINAALITGLEKVILPAQKFILPAVKKFILPAREIVKTLSKNILKEASKFSLMPYSDDEEHSPSEFYYPDEISDETNDPNGRLEGENGFSSEKVFCFFSTKSEQTAIQQSNIINPLLTSFALSVRESIAFGFNFIAQTSLLRRSVCTKNLRQYFPVQTSQSVNKSLLLYPRLLSVFIFYAY